MKKINLKKTIRTSNSSIIDNEFISKIDIIIQEKKRIIYLA